MAWSSTRRASGATTPKVDENIWARGINVALGIWLFISAFLWLHTSAQFTNTWLVGLAIAVVAAVGFAVPQARWINTALAAWLIISVWALPTFAAATFWNNLLVGIASLIVSVMPFATEYGGRTTRGYAGRERHA